MNLLCETWNFYDAVTVGNFEGIMLWYIFYFVLTAWLLNL